MQSVLVTEQSLDYSRDILREQLLELFDTSGRGEHAEKRMEARVSQMIRGFLREVDFSSAIEIRHLIERFSDSRIPVEPYDAQEYLDLLDDNVVAHSTRTASPLFIAHMTSALPLFVRPLARLMAALNQNVVKAETAKALTPYERQALAMIHRLIFRLPDEFYSQHGQSKESTLGMIVSGGTIANITALWCARNASLGPRDGFGGVEAEGLSASLKAYGYDGAVVIGSSLAHYSVEKAVGVLGLGSLGLIKVPADRQNRLDLTALVDAIAECRRRNQLVIAIVGIAGTTDTGAIDPLSGIADIANEACIHFHVDAAWGGPVLFSERYRHMLAGIERADSVTIDGHKQMYLPMGIGMVMLRDPVKARTIEKQARYIVRPGSIDLGRRALEGSRPAVALFLHTALHIIGSRGYELLVDDGIEKARYLADQIRRRPEFELLAEPEVNILVYRYIPPTLRSRVASGKLTDAENQLINLANERLHKAQRRAGRTFVSRTSLMTTRHRGVPISALRVVLPNPLTQRSDTDAVLDDQLEIGAALNPQHSDEDRLF